MKKSEIVSLPIYFNAYFNLLKEEDLNLCLEKSLNEITELNIEQLLKLRDKIYAPKKWTIKDILQHLIDTERIMSYRALRFARKDKNEIEGFDEDSFAENTTAKNRTVNDLLEEYILVRKSSVFLFKNFSDQMLKTTGKANGKEISVLALGFIICGHQKHHFNIIEQRYIPLLEQM
ncbi:MAG: DinB family protein [Bacteroidota bacterium]|nr:DinB family protein [Bacteroidota bacterium]